MRVSIQLIQIQNTEYMNLKSMRSSTFIIESSNWNTWSNAFSRTCGIKELHHLVQKICGDKKFNFYLRRLLYNPQEGTNRTTSFIFAQFRTSNTISLDHVHRLDETWSFRGGSGVKEADERTCAALDKACERVRSILFDPPFVTTTWIQWLLPWGRTRVPLLLVHCCYCLILWRFLQWNSGVR